MRLFLLLSWKRSPWVARSLPPEWVGFRRSLTAIRMDCCTVRVHSEDLAAQIIALLNDPERAAKLGKHAAIDSKQRFSRELVAERALNCYGKAIERNRLRK